MSDACGLLLHECLFVQVSLGLPNISARRHGGHEGRNIFWLIPKITSVTEAHTSRIRIFCFCKVKIPDDGF